MFDVEQFAKYNLTKGGLFFTFIRSHFRNEFTLKSLVEKFNVLDGDKRMRTLEMMDKRNDIEEKYKADPPRYQYTVTSETKADITDIIKTETEDKLYL